MDGGGAINNRNFLRPNNFGDISGTTNGNTLLPRDSATDVLGQDLDMTVTALATDAGAKILQRPRIQTSHNEPASLFVGSRVLTRRRVTTVAGPTAGIRRFSSCRLA